ncbi:cAMP-regulated phosphoprotein 19-like [Anneissia japonica]|uniref:cAMP-regulated phosphoprotein 19-like n=1 Tax=Anneissia japonica TaxID=1529436 RepID=UPI0014256D86|nr:cAMP-regulated phosphoprotein 19-like [Anneissia japonica]
MENKIVVVEKENQKSEAEPKKSPPIDSTATDDLSKEEKISPEQEAEAKLRSKYGNMRKPGGSELLKKRLQRGNKFFDSGDYMMAKQNQQKVKPGRRLQPELVVGGMIPTPALLPQRKPSGGKSKLAALDH